MVDDLLKPRVAQWLSQQKSKYTVGGYGGHTLYAGLYEAGLGHIATEDYKRYDDMLKLNNTCWESFGALSSANMGNHAWTAYPSYLLQRYVAGIRPVAGGFSTFEVKPITGGLDWAKATVPTIKGNISTYWNRISNEKLILEVTVPANTKANIYVPNNDMGNVVVKENNQVIFENGNFVEGVNGIKSGNAEGNFIVFSVGSGSYSFEITGTPLNTPLPDKYAIPPLTDEQIKLIESYGA